MGLYFAIDGPDGCGKSTQSELLVRALAATGADVVHLREPGSTPVGEQLRRLLLDPRSGELDPWSEALLFSAARREMVVRELRPALERGAVVVAERCFVSTVVYQGLAPNDPTRRVPVDAVRTITAAVQGDVLPDLVVLLDVDAATARMRLRGGPTPDRIERRDDGYHERVRDAYRELARPGGWLQAMLPRRDDGVVLVDAARGTDAVHADVLAAAQRLIVARRGP